MRRMLVSLVVVAALLGACGGKKNPPVDTTTGDTPLPATGVSFYDGPPPWPLDGKQVEHMVDAGITPLTAEGTKVHYHAHLDVFYDGQRVKVPANLGIDFDKGRI